MEQQKSNNDIRGVLQILQLNKMENIKKYTTFKTSCSSGAGGQHVNKTETKVQATFNVIAYLPSVELETERELILSLGREFTVTSQKTRSQVLNKEICLTKIKNKLEKALNPQKERVETTVTKESKEKRLKRKSIISEKKKSRKQCEEIF